MNVNKQPLYSRAFLENIPFNNPMIPEDYTGGKLYLTGKLQNLIANHQYQMVY